MPVLLEQDTAHLLNTSSVFGVFAGTLGPYGVTKHAVTALTETVYFNLKSLGVTNVGVSVLCPSAVRTNFGTSDRNRPAWAGRTKVRDEEAQASAERFNELSKLGASPAEVAERVVNGIRSRRFYILTAENRLEPIIRRGQEIAAGGPPEPPVNFV
jgi:NAD(P)-dependent dehydrogenase (short-subunit alcohol dehydrogenase family)